ncbi:MAG: DUF3159 domain-containing protein [Sediminispirochaetaceae bacterium]
MRLFTDIYDELKKLVFSRPDMMDLVLPPLVFLILHFAAGLYPALFVSLFMTIGFLIYRWTRKEPVKRSLEGLLVILIAFALVFLLKREEGVFLPSMLTGAVTAVLAPLSIAAKRPLVAWMSFISRGWPLEWYRHPRVRPAYTETTWLWALYFSLRLAGQIIYFQQGNVDQLVFLNFLLGWPGILGLLIITYIYGIIRLGKLGGPSVEEFRNGTDPPWEGQKKGF